MGATAHCSIQPLLRHQYSKLTFIQDVEKILNNLHSWSILRYEGCFPAVSKLRKYPASPSDDYFNFVIESKFRDRQPNSLLYNAKMPDKQPVLIKSTRRYSIELHHFCAKLGRAPQIFAFERLPGGWFGVAMEYIESGIPITCSTLLAAHRDRWTKELQHLVENFHSRGRDLRDPNILCNGESVMLVDFDWGGKDGEALLSHRKPQLRAIRG